MSTERQCMSHSAITDGVEGRRSSVFISRLVLRGHQPEHGCNPRATCACNHPIVGDPWTASPRGAHQTEARVTRRTHANLVSGIKISQSPTEDQQRHSPNHMRPQDDTHWLLASKCPSARTGHEHASANLASPTARASRGRASPSMRAGESAFPPPTHLTRRRR